MFPTSVDKSSGLYRLAWPHLNKFEDEPELVKELPDIWTGKGRHGQLERRTNGRGGKGGHCLTFLALATKITVKNFEKRIRHR